MTLMRPGTILIPISDTNERQGETNFNLPLIYSLENGCVISAGVIVKGSPKGEAIDLNLQR